MIQMKMNMKYILHKPKEIFLKTSEFKQYANTLYEEQKANPIKYMGMPVQINEAKSLLDL